MIDIVAIKARFETLAPYLDERARRLFAATEARAAGRGGVAAVSEATGVARSTIGRGLAELRSENARLTRRVRRPGGGRKPKIETEPGLLAALEQLVQSAIRGDPEAALRWVSRSQRHLARALAELGFTASQKLVGRLLRGLASAAGQPEDARGDAPSRPRRPVRAHQRQDQTVPDRRATGHLGRYEEEGAGRRLQERRARAARQRRS